MKQTKRILITMILMVMALFFTACGCETKANVKVNPDGSGSRTMVLSIPKTELTGLGKTKLSEVDSIISNATPKCMTYTYKEDGKNYVATFVLPFDSTEDYEKKLNTFCKKKAQIKREISRSPFAMKISYSENISTTEMLEWLVDALIDNKVISEKNRSSFFESVSTTLEFEGRTYEGGSGRLSVTQSVYCEISSLDIYTTYVGEGKYSRVITLNIKDTELAKNEEAIKTFLNESIPDGGYGAWDGNKYSVVMTELTPEEMKTAMAGFTGWEEYDFTPMQQKEEDSLFIKSCGFFEDADWSNYVCNAKGTVNVNYYLDRKNSEGSISIDRSDAYEVIEAVEDEKSSYICFPLGLVNSFGVRADLVHYYHPDKVDYTLTTGKDGSLRKEIEFHYDNVRSAEIAEVADSIDAMREEEGNEALACLETEAGEEALKFVMTGSAADINEAMRIVSGREECKDLAYANETSWLKPVRRMVLSDTINLEGFVYSDSTYTDYWRVPIQYQASIPGLGATIVGDAGPLLKTGNNVEGKLHTNEEKTFVYTSIAFNWLAFAWYALIAVFALTLLGGIYFIIRSAVAKRNEARAILENAPLPAEMPAIETAAAPVVEAVSAQALPEVAVGVAAEVPEEPAPEVPEPDSAE
jgi:hypothetical protein